MASEGTRPQSGNTSGESKGSSGGQTSMLELLTITDAAVKALNKSTHSTSSQGSKKSQFSGQRCQSIQSESSRRGQSIHSDHSEKSTHSQLISNRSLKSAHSGQLDSDWSAHSRQSVASGQSIQSHRSNQSVQSYHSDQSQQSGRSVGNAKGTPRVHDASHDSGVVSKTNTVSEEKSKFRGVTLTSPTDGSLQEQSSDVSTTASDVLIKSTLDKSERSILAEGHHGNNGSSSGSSKCSKTSFGVENFNSSGPHKVKISRKHLREIKAPFEDGSPRSSSSSDGKVPSALFGVNGKQSARSNASQTGKMKDIIPQRKDADREVVTTSNESNGDKFPLGRSFPRGINNGDDQFKVEKVRKSADKAYEDVNMVTKSKPKTNGHILRDDLEMKSRSSTGNWKSVDVAAEIHVKENMNKLNMKDGKISDRNMQFKSTPKYYVERHTPQKSQTRVEAPVTSEAMPERKNLLQDLEDSVEIITTHGRSRDTSGSSSQPEIVTVPERIVTVTARNSVSPASSVSDLVTKTTPPTETYHSAGYKLRDDKGPDLEEKGKTLDDSNIIPPALSRQHDDNDDLKTAESRPIPPRFQWFSRQATGHGLQQGAPVNGHEAPDRHKDEDVHISDFKLTEKQKMAKDIFARRQGGPIRRVVQPRIVGHDSKASSTSSTGELRSQHPQLGQANDQVLTAAAAASAAVAATQPFLKAQQEMELKMAEVLARIADLQSRASQKPGELEKAPERVQQLEKQLADMTDKRIEYMERLQEQQMAMQAKLLSMTRESTTFRTYQPRSYSPEPHAASKAFSKTTVSRQPNMGDYSKIKHSALDLDKEESSSPLDTPAPRARAPRPTICDTSDIEHRVGRARSPKARSPNARSIKVRSPKPRSRSPAKEKIDRGILHQILASVDSPARDVYGGHRAPPAVQYRVPNVCESPNVRKAKDLIDDLSHIKEQVKGLVEEKDSWKSSAKETSIQEPVRPHTSYTGPSPLDSYLYLPEQSASSPYKSVPDLSFSKINAPVLPGFKDAESILRQVQQNRGYLESNFEAVLRARHEVEVYSMLEVVYNDSTDHEKANIQQMVDKSIQRLRREVAREVTDELVISEVKKGAVATVPGAVKMPEPVQAPKQSTRFGIKGRLQQPKVEPKVESKRSTIKRPGMGGKENVQHKFYRPAPKRKSVFEDEEAMTRIYGKASYQKGRTTVKDPYLHFQNTAKQKPPRQASQPTVKGTEVMSSKTQTSEGGVRQFYFNPSTGTYIPIATTASAPIPGQLIPMAVPLGGPRMDPGLTMPTSMTSTPGAATFHPGHMSQVTADGHVSMVSMGMENDERNHRPELGKQVLPAVDIDTDISELSDILDEGVRGITPEAKATKHVQIVSPRGTPNTSPTKAHYEVIYHEDDTLPDDDVDVESAVGLELPGYQLEELSDDQYNGPAFPPKLPSAERQLTSELIAEDIRRRDLLQNKATEWIEQELMARIITEVYPLRETEEPLDLSHVVSETSQDSMAEDKEKSMFVMDTIGHHGMQLFVDSGYPVDNSLVNRLVEEVLQEKLRTMLGQRPDSEDQLRDPPRRQEDGPLWEEPISEDLDEPSMQQPVIHTPEPTPRTSPRSSPPRRVSPAQTPLASPPSGTPRMAQEMFEPPEPLHVIPQPVIQPVEPESEPESSATYDINDELDRLADKLQPDSNISASIQSKHDVITPPESPKLEPIPLMPARPLTPPEPSPRAVSDEPYMFPAGISLEQTPSRISKTKTSSPKSATSPQVTELAEEELAEDQPKPVVFTVAETQTDKPEETRPRSPSPAKSCSRSPSESSYSESSSISDTFNECVSEGQWLINKSDGEVADFPINEDAVRERMLRMSRRKVDVSSASTWKDIDDVDLEEMTDASRSEGEFLYKTEFPPEKDPVLDMLSRLQSAAPQYGMYHMSQRQVADVLNTTGKSEGEVIRVAAASQQQYIPERDTEAPQRSKSPRTRSQQGGATAAQRDVSSPQKGRASQKRSQSPQFRGQSPHYRVQSPTRVSFEADFNEQPRSVSPTRGILKRGSSFENRGQPMRSEEFEVPVRDSGRIHTPTGRLTPGGRQAQSKGMIVAGGRTSTTGKSSIRRPPQVIKSATMPETRGSGSRPINVRTSSEDYRDSQDITGGQSYYGSDYNARNMTPDQMNVDALIQSGYMSQSFSQSENGTQRTGQSSLKSSADLQLTRTSASGRSLGYSYGTNESMSMSELQRLSTSGTGKLRMSLTIPGTDLEESDLSEIDITDGGNTK